MHRGALLSDKQQHTDLLSVVFGVEGHRLSPQEKSFLNKANPFGFILFSRNIDNPKQVQELVTDLRETVGRPDAPILIDQEGGRVARLCSPHWSELPALARIGDLPIEEATKAASLHASIIADMLRDLGINVVCAPVLDVPVPGSHDVIGDRAFSQDTETVSILGNIYTKTLLEHGVTPIIKHIPGHGRAKSDSHFDCPHIEDDLQTLQDTDFKPFKHVASSYGDGIWGMTAHVVLEDIDKENPATVSPSIIDRIIRQYIGFNGFLIADDVSMAALSGDLQERALNCIQAGCDAILHCNGRLDEMKDIAAVIPKLSSSSYERFKQAEKNRHISKKIDTSPLHERINALYDMMTDDLKTANLAGHGFLDQ